VGQPRTVATRILLGRERQCHSSYATLASHYVFAPLFGMPARGHETPDAEATVTAVQQRFATPVPRAANLDELNMIFRKCCEAEPQRTVQSLFGPFLIPTRLAEDRGAATPLPKHPFDPCVIHPAVALDKYPTGASDANRYSVPRRFAFRIVTVMGDVDRVVIVTHGPVVATHERSWEKPTMIRDPIHSLVTLGRQPGTLDHAPVFRDWKLPACFAVVRAERERRHDARGGSRRVVRVVQLLGEHPMARVTQAIAACRCDHLHSAEAVIPRTRARAAIEATHHDAAVPAETPAASRVDVPLPDLSRFNQLRSGPAAEGPLSVRFAGSGRFNHVWERKVIMADATIEWLTTQLRPWRLPTRGREFENLTRDAAATKPTCAQFVLRLTELELATRALKAVATRIKDAGFPVEQDFDTSDFGVMPQRSQPKLLELARWEWIAQKSNCCWVGSHGTGTPRIAIGLGRAACRAGLRVRFFTAAELVSRLEQEQPQYTLDRVRTPLDRARLWIGDELG
jgi:hypothetical protein